MYTNFFGELDAKLLPIGIKLPLWFLICNEIPNKRVSILPNGDIKWKTCKNPITTNSSYRWMIQVESKENVIHAGSIDSSKVACFEILFNSLIAVYI